MKARVFQIKDKIETDKTIKITPFRKEIRKTTPHRHNNYFEIIYLSSGKGFHTIDSKRYKVKPPVIFCIRKEQMHHWELTTEPKGSVLIIRKSFIDKSHDNGLKALLEKLSGYSCLYLVNNTVVDHLFNLLIDENKTDNQSYFEVTEGLLKALLAKILEVAKPSSIIKKEIKSTLYQAYRELLSSNTTIKINVAHYAALLNTTPQNLNATCRKAINQSASEVLADFIISEAKRLLIYTGNTVSEISTTLDFKDVSHFVKYFKRFTRTTPQSFRYNQA